METSCCSCQTLKSMIPFESLGFMLILAVFLFAVVDFNQFVVISHSLTPSPTHTLPLLLTCQVEVGREGGA